MSHPYHGSIVPFALPLKSRFFAAAAATLSRCSILAERFALRSTSRARRRVSWRVRELKRDRVRKGSSLLLGSTNVRLGKCPFCG